MLKTAWNQIIQDMFFGPTFLRFAKKKIKCGRKISEVHEL